LDRKRDPRKKGSPDIMTEARSFSSAKLICGLIAARSDVFSKAENLLINLYGKVDHSSPLIEFDCTDYYEKQMGSGLKRKFVSFTPLFSPEDLSEIKIRTNQLEEEIRTDFRSSLRIINIDPGFLTASSVIMATAKDFAHRIPLQKGIYAHLEFLFGRNDIRTLSWTYPDFQKKAYQKFFLEARKIYLSQIR
jgi:hypothetical protein